MDICLRIATGIVINKMKENNEYAKKLGLKDVSIFDGVLVKNIEQRKGGDKYE